MNEKIVLIRHLTFAFTAGFKSLGIEPLSRVNAWIAVSPFFASGFSFLEYLINKTGSDDLQEILSPLNAVLGWIFVKNHRFALL